MPDDEIQGGVVAPAETVTPVATDEVKPESAQDKPAESQSEETASEDGEKEKPVEKLLTQEQVNEILSREKAKLVRQRDAARKTAEELAQQVVKQSLQEAPGKPDLANYSDAEQYANDFAKWKLGEREWQEQQVQVSKQQISFDQQIVDFVAELNEAGIDTQKLGTLPLSDAAIQALVNSDGSAHERLATHLLTHPEDVQRISALRPELQAAEIGKLEVKLSTTPKVSQAPAPINPIGAGKAQTIKSPENMSHEEYRAWRTSQGARWSK